jgi:hypothetical protein
METCLSMQLQYQSLSWKLPGKSYLDSWVQLFLNFSNDKIKEYGMGMHGPEKCIQNFGWEALRKENI